MTDLLDRAVQNVRSLSPEMQDDIARMLLAYTGEDKQPIALTPAETADLDESDAEITRGEYATEEHMRHIWTKHDA